MRNQISRSIYGNRVAVEHELIVPADGVAVANRTTVGDGERAHHLATHGRLVQREWRSAQVYNDLGAFFDQATHRLDVVERARQIMFGPDIFTNGDAHFLPRNQVGLPVATRFEITIFVKNVIGWQKRFVNFTERLTRFE